jgi:hypothetical protein
MGAWGKEMNANQEKAETDRKADSEALNKMNANVKSKKEMTKSNQEKVDGDRIAAREYMKQMMARTDENQERMAINVNK